MTSQESILVVDDDFSFVSYICDVLSRHRLQSTVALTGADALLQIQRTRHSAVLLDLKLPDCSGLDVLREIRRRGSLVPIVIVTGEGSVASAVEAMRLGAIHFLEKPVRRTQLATMVQSLLSPPPSRVAASVSSMNLDSLFDQLARAMCVVVHCPEDVPTVRDWCVLVGRSRSSLYALCEMVGIRAKRALDLVRILRAASLRNAADFRAEFLVADPRTVTRLLKRAGTLDTSRPSPDYDRLLEQQQLILDTRIIDRLSLLLRTPRVDSDT